MKGAFRQSMAWLHTWTGLVVGWALFVIFATGSAAYFQEEITAWMQPEARPATNPVQAAEDALAFQQRAAPEVLGLYVTLPGPRGAATQLFWYPEADGREPGREATAWLDASGREVAARATEGGYFLYRFHFDLHYLPVIWARYLVGVCAMTMLAAILTGIVTHKKIFADFFTLRLGKGQRSWLDAHNVTGVLALPFHLMITYTGLVSLGSQYMPFGIQAAYEDPFTYQAEILPTGPAAAPAGRAAPAAPLAPMFAVAAERWDGARVGFVNVANPGDANARVTLVRASDAGMATRGESLVFDGVTGALIAPASNTAPAAKTESVMIGLHAGRYAGTLLRWLYFLCGLAGAAMIATGLVLWTVKRRAKLPDPARPHFGFRLVERLNVAAVAGFPLGLASYFLANRLLPLGLTGRAQWEVHCIFIAWGAAAAWAMVRPPRLAWTEVLGAAAAAFALVPVVNALTTPRNLVASLVQGDFAFAAVDLVMIALAAAFAWAARKAASSAAARPRPAPARAAGAEA
ncbi:MAG: PepSY-associated TM helix domain-containing protein [Phenylobacterium sp.]|uniref:PepSY-associated TM helix domain-containing protein n=1 Tax=Phenylobacterium sp. TaxID=1871053 RepID=UPI00391BF04E